VGSQHDDKIECWHFIGGRGGGIGGIGGGRRQTPPAEYLAGIACMAQIYLKRPAVPRGGDGLILAGVLRSRYWATSDDLC
jgi:hypothetical protein